MGASAAEVQAGLEGVCGYGAGNVEVTEAGAGEYAITFKGAPFNEPPVKELVELLQRYEDLELVITVKGEGPARWLDCGHCGEHG